MKQTTTLTPTRSPRSRYRDLPDLGSARIAPERFTSAEHMRREWRCLWSRVWLCGPYQAELSRPGDYIVEQWGRESLLFVKGGDEIIRAFFNVCPHRGRQLISNSSHGRIGKRIACQYHGWRFGLDGNCVHIPDLEEFPQFDGGAPQSEVHLSGIRCEVWSGYVWFNLDPHCGPLLDYLGPLAEHIASYDLASQRPTDFVTWEWPCNWKVAADAFNEAYHFASQHPEMVRYGDDMPEIELLGDHSVMKVRYGTVSEKLADRSTISPFMAEWMKTYYGLDETNYQGAAKDVHAAHLRRVRSQQAYGLADYSRLSDQQVTEDWSYLCFPNTSWNMMAEGGAAYRYRPHPSDPNRCFFDLSLFRHCPPGEQFPAVSRKLLAWDADLAVEMPGMPGQGALAIAQDMANVGAVQEGMHSQGFRGLILGKPEIRLRHFYRTIDRYLAGREIEEKIDEQSLGEK